MPRVVIVGGGFAALQAAFALRRALGEKARLFLISDRLEFVYRPNTLYVPFGLSPARLLLQLSEPARRKGIELRIARAIGLRVRERRLVTEAGDVSLLEDWLRERALLSSVELGVVTHEGLSWDLIERMMDAMVRLLKGVRRA